jgi:hypothetical protein
MKVCPYCGHTKTGINGTESKDPDSRRYRVCMGCGKSFTTIEVVVVNTGEGYVPLQQSGPIRPPASTSFRRPDVPPDTWGLPYQLAIDITHWWEVSRWGKWGSKAVWTERAFKASLARVQQLHLAMPDRARQLVAEGVEKGWQALDPKYLAPDRLFGRGAAAPTQATPMGPVSATMQSALERWNDNP